MATRKHRPSDVLVARIAAWQAIIVALITAAGGLGAGLITTRPSEPSGQPSQIPAALLCDRLNVSIDEHTDEVTSTQSVVVTGRASLQPGFRLWLVATPRGSDEYWLRKEIVPRHGTWRVEIQPNQGSSRADAGKQKQFAALITGPNGQTYVQAYLDIMREIQPDVWPGLRKMTGDMALCPGRHRVVFK